VKQLINEKTMGKRLLCKRKKGLGEQNPYLRRSDDYGGMRMKHKMMTYDSFLGAVW
jgi:hypothetical protein